MTVPGKFIHQVGTASKLMYAALGVFVTLVSGLIAVLTVATWKPTVTHVVLLCVESVGLMVLILLPWFLYRRSRKKILELEARLQIPFPKVRSFQSPTRRKNRTEVAVRGLTSATRTIDACGIANEMITSDLSADFLPKFFERGGSVRALFMNPAPHGIAEERERAEGHPPRSDTLAVKASRNIKYLLTFEGLVTDLQKQWRDYGVVAGPIEPQRPHLEIRIYDKAPRANMLIVDSGWALVHHYGESTAGTASPVVEVDARADVPRQLTDESEVQANRARHRNRDAVNFYVQDFESMWNNSDPLPSPFPEEWA